MKIVKYIILAVLLISCPCWAGDIPSPPKLNKDDVKPQQEYLQTLYENLNKLPIVTSDPNGSRQGNFGDLIGFNNAGSFSLRLCSSSPDGTSWTNPSGGGSVDLTTGVTGILPTANGGTGTSSNSNSANGVVVLNGSSQLPAVSGALLTNLPAQVTEATTSTGDVLFNTGPTTILSQAKTITSGHTVLIIARGKLFDNGSSTTVTLTLKADASTLETFTITTANLSDNTYGFSGKNVPWNFSGVIVTGLSGSVTFTVVGSAPDGGSNKAQGILTIIEF